MEIIWPQPGKYVVAVSGGVDSMVLLDLLAGHGKYEIVVAHFNHGWRADADKDERLVHDAAHNYGLDFVAGSPDEIPAGEAAARHKRYAFLRTIAEDFGAAGIITAHHWDDLQETAIFNLLRGTGRRGLSFGNEVLRPLAEAKKTEIIDYAKSRNIGWREDSTNVDITFSRNWIRHVGLPGAHKKDKKFDERWTKLLQEAESLNAEFDIQLIKWMDTNAKVSAHKIEFPIGKLRRFSLDVVQEIIMHTVRRLDPGAELDERAVAELALHTKTGRINAERQLHDRLFAHARYGTLTITVRAKSHL